MADHFVEQIMSAIMTELESVGSFDVLRSPVDALSGNLSQLPAVCVWQGEAEPRDGEDGMEVMGSYRERQVVYCDCWERSDQSTSVETKLNELRKLVHIELMGSNLLGVSRVFNVVPQGAEEPELSADGNALVGKLRTIWLVEYASSVTDPSV